MVLMIDIMFADARRRLREQLEFEVGVAQTEIKRRCEFARRSIGQKFRYVMRSATGKII